VRAKLAVGWPDDPARRRGSRRRAELAVLALLRRAALGALLGLARHVEGRGIEQRPDLDLRLVARERRTLGPIDRLGERLERDASIAV
jgi:hypothetical protein